MDIEEQIVQAVLNADEEHKPGLELMRDAIQRVLRAHDECSPQEFQQTMRSLASGLSHTLGLFMAMSVRREAFAEWSASFAEEALEVALHYRDGGVGEEHEATAVIVVSPVPS